MKRRGFTLLELVIYAALFLLAGTAVVSLFTLGNRAEQSTISSYLVSGQTDTAVRWLRQDLQETALVSLRTYPNGASPGEPPGCSFVSARNTSDQDSGQLNVSSYGSPLWTKNVFYTLVLTSGSRYGELVRWEQALPAVQKDYVPRPATMMPSSVSSHDPTRRVVLHSVLAPNTSVKNLGGLPSFVSDSYGGFRVEYIRRVGGESGSQQLSPINPGDTTQPQNPADNTSLVDVQLEILAADDYQPSFYSIDFHVHPRY